MVPIAIAIEVGLGIIRAAQDAIAAGNAGVAADELKKHVALLDQAEAENTAWQQGMEGVSPATGKAADPLG